MDVCVPLVACVCFLFLLALVPGSGPRHLPSRCVRRRLRARERNCCGMAQAATRHQHNTDCPEHTRKAHPLSPLLPKETSVGSSNVQKNLKNRLKYTEVAFHSRGRNGERVFCFWAIFLIIALSWAFS